MDGRAAAAVGAAIWVTIGWLLSSTREVLARDTKTTSGADRAQARVEIVRTGLAAGAGVGAAVGLMLNFRRQRHQEIDAAEQRITAMYNAAAEQLGSDKAPVRLTALYTLERLANDSPGHRQRPSTRARNTRSARPPSGSSATTYARDRARSRPRPDAAGRGTPAGPCADSRYRLAASVLEPRGATGRLRPKG
jgi:hypothetical protein